MDNRLTIYFTSDTHGYLYPTNFVDAQPRPVGLMAMAFEKDGNTLVLDGGDTLQGSPLTYYCHAQGLPMPCADVMNALGYDYVTLGNHDFNYGYDTLAAHLTGLRARCLCANVRDKTGRLPIAPYAVHTLANGLRVGLVGAVTPWVNLWERPENLTNLLVGDPYAAVREAVEALRSQTDLLVGIYHGGFERDLETGRLLSDTDENIACRLCEDFPFDILLTGHQHIPLANTVYRGTHVVQTPCNGAAYVRLTVDGSGAIASQLCSPQHIRPLRPAEEALYCRLQAWMDAPIGRLDRPLAPEGKLTMALHGSAIARFFNQVQLAASGADISCTALGNVVRGFSEVVTVRDVVASYVYTNTLVVLRVTGAMVRQALEQCATYFSVGEGGALSVAEAFMRPKESFYNYDFFDGVEYTFDLRRPTGERVTRLTRAGTPVAPSQTFTLVTNHYRATGAGGFDYYRGCERVREIQTEVSELILSYLGERALVTVPQENAYIVIGPHGGAL